MEPFLFCNDEENPVYNTLKEYINTVDDLAEEFYAILVPLQKLINEKIKNISSQNWSDDMVHPFLWAHAWIAQQWLKVTQQ